MCYDIYASFWAARMPEWWNGFQPLQNNHRKASRAVTYCYGNLADRWRYNTIIADILKTCTARKFCLFSRLGRLWNSSVILDRPSLIVTSRFCHFLYIIIYRHVTRTNRSRWNYSSHILLLRKQYETTLQCLHHYHFSMGQSNQFLLY